MAKPQTLDEMWAEFGGSGSDKDAFITGVMMALINIKEAAAQSNDVDGVAAYIYRLGQDCTRYQIEQIVSLANAAAPR